ncbi:hypothetical protein ACIO6T_29175 [Streptomyces sp. NPDC087532]|uniref:hypothetical protein n=1 Tax=Streptomyces sp. NPDC087532 TaxID=3365795 RepID=UPI0037F25293
MVRRPVDGEVHVHYGQIYVESDPDSSGPDLDEAFAGQTAGLCGAAIPGALWLTTGLHTGDVGFTVEVHDRVPPLDPAWEDVVEVSFRPLSVDSALTEWAGEDAWELDLEMTDYRVRYCAQGMDRAFQQDTRLDEEPQVDRYLLQFWPALPEADRVLRQSAEIAAYWHDHARRQPSPATPAERAERAESECAAALAQERADRERELAFEQWEWGGRLPGQALREVGGNVCGLLEFDADLVHAIDAAGPGTQRTVALLAARRACEAAGLTRLDWITEALTALAEGRPLPAPFDDPERVWQTLESDPRVPNGTVGRAVPPVRPPFRPPAAPGASTPESQQASYAVTGPATTATWSTEPLGTSNPPGPGSRTLRVTFGVPDPSVRMSQPHMAVPALLGAAEADPLRAALDAVFAAVVTYGEDYPALLQDIWSVCAGPT